MAGGVNIGELFVRLSGDVTQLRKDMASAQGIIANGSKAIGNTLKTLGVTIGAGLVMKKFIDETTQAQDAQAQLAARLKATGGAAGKTMDDLTGLASALQNTTTFSDEAVQSVEALLLSFKNISGKVFDDAVKASLDLATAMGVDATTAAKSLGKALADPEKAAGALKKAAVVLTDAQKDQIKAMVDAGNVAGAQALIIAEVESRYKGAAEAARNTLGGALKALGNQWGELFEVTDDASSGIVGAINAISDALPGVKTALNEFIGGIQLLGVDAAVGLGKLEVGMLRIARLNPIALLTDRDDKALANAITNLGFLKQAAADVRAEILGIAPPLGNLPKEIEGITVVIHKTAEALTKEQIAAKAAADELKRLNEQKDALNKGLPTTEKLLEGTAQGTLREKRKNIGKVATGRTLGSGEAEMITPIDLPSERAMRTRTEKTPGPSLADQAGEAFGNALDVAKNALADFGPAAIAVSAAFQVLKGIMEPLQPILDVLSNLLQSVGNVLGGVLQPILKAVAKVFTYIIQAVGYFVEALGVAIDKLVPDWISEVGKGLKQQGKDLVANAKAQREQLDAVKDATDYIGDLGEEAKRTAETLSNVPDIWNANLARFRAVGASVGGASRAATASLTSQAGPSYTFTGSIVLPGVKNAPDFYREVAVEAVRITARGGSPVLVDASQRRSY